jgi:hypothetical protein
MAEFDIEDHLLPLYHRRRNLRLHTISVAVVVLLENLLPILKSLYIRIPLRTSILTGRAWIHELLQAENPNRIHVSLGVRKHVFLQLISVMRAMGLEDSRHVTLEEQLGIFLHASVTGLTNRHMAERFQRSNHTISRCVTLDQHRPS